MRKIFILSVVALLICGVSYSDVTGSRIGDVKRNAVTITNKIDGTGHVHVTTSPCYVWRVTLNLEATSTRVQLYDSDGTKAYSDVNTLCAALVSPSAQSWNASAEINTPMYRVKADIGVGTAALATVITYDPPLYFDYGLLAGFIDLTAAPTSQDDSTATIEYSTVN